MDDRTARLNYIEDRLKDPTISWAETQLLLGEKYELENNIVRMTKTKMDYYEQLQNDNKRLVRFELIVEDDGFDFEHEGYFDTKEELIEYLNKHF